MKIVWRIVKWFFSVVVLGVVIGLITNMLDRSLNWNIYPEKIAGFFNSLGSTLYQGFQYGIPVWAILTTVLVILVVLLAFAEYDDRKPGLPIQLDTVPFTHYVKDDFGALGNTHRWTWEYNGNTIMNVVPVCPTCNANGIIDNFHGISYSGDKTAAKCAKCRLEGRPYSFIVDENASDVGREIARRINTGEYTGK